MKFFYRKKKNNKFLRFYKYGSDKSLGIWLSYVISLSVIVFSCLIRMK